ncbi:MAG: hypothetical protein K6F22_11330 [Prevotella sp.]|nr:hypothetical protein [Prevotella sp.]
MDILPIDFDMTIVEISKWFDQWKSERFGGESLQPERYYNITEDGRFLYGVKEGESLNDEKAICDRVLDLLLKIRLINQKLSGRGLSRHLQYVEREQLKKEREGLYNDFLELSQQPQSLNPEPQQIAKELITPEANGYFKKAIDLGLMDSNFRWLKGLQMLACFAREMSLKLNMGKGDRIAWKPFEMLFGVPLGKLRLNYNDIQKTGQDPKEAYLINRIFE